MGRSTPFRPPTHNSKFLQGILRGGILRTPLADQGRDAMAWAAEGFLRELISILLKTDGGLSRARFRTLTHCIG
eukprot:SAG11_NODE_4283_length_1969_cov_1.498930_1_plen_74_part_00